MKKAVIATMLSVSLFAVPTVQAQAHIQSYPGTPQYSTETDMGANSPLVFQWILQGVIYYVLEKALDIAWNLATSGESKDVKDGCDFIEEYGTTYPAACEAEEGQK